MYRRLALPTSCIWVIEYFSRPVPLLGPTSTDAALSPASSRYQKAGQENRSLPQLRLVSLPPLVNCLDLQHSQDAGHPPLLLHLGLYLHGPHDGRPLAVQGVDDGDLPGQGEA